MNSETLLEKLHYTKAYRQTRLDVANWVLKNPEVFPELLSHCYSNKEPICYKAAWILEFVCIEKLSLLYPYLNVYFEHLPKEHRDQSLRPLSKICKMLTHVYYTNKDIHLKNSLTKNHKDIIVSCSFDWLITDQKVACQVYAMESLYYIGTEIDWVHTELKTIIEANILQSSPAYKVRGKRVLKQIQKFKDNKINV